MPIHLPNIATRDWKKRPYASGYHSTMWDLEEIYGQYFTMIGEVTYPYLGEKDYLRGPFSKFEHDAHIIVTLVNGQFNSLYK